LKTSNYFGVKNSVKINSLKNKFKLLIKKVGLSLLIKIIFIEDDKLTNL
jgi:hypothetical protein